MNQQSPATLDKNIAPLAGSELPLLWHRPNDAPLRLTGFPWFEQDQVYRRLPLAPAQPLPPAVDQLANNTAGGQIAFQSDSTHLAVKVALAGPADMDHMPATGQCGFDLYVGPPLAQRYHGTTRYDQRETAYEALLFEHADAEMRNFTLNFPLYQSVKSIQIGLLPEARLEAPPPWAMDGKVVIYGTSITQGGCACRPGMAYTNIVSRALNVEIVNQGYSGTGRGEPEVIEVMAGMAEPRLFVLDYEANAGYAGMEATLPGAIRILREAHATVPILVISRIPFAYDITHEDRRIDRDRCRDMQAAAVQTAMENGDGPIEFLDGSTLLGDDFDECTVDGVHPTDLGFMRMAHGLTPPIRRMLALTPNP